MTYCLEDLPRDERTAFTAIVEAEDGKRGEALAEYLALRKRKRRKAAADYKRDQERRVLIGARITREDAARIRRAAEIEGESLYSFAYRALMKEVEEINPYDF